MSKYDKYYDQLMRGYYKILVNTWDAKRKEALRLAIKLLSEMPRSEKVSEKMVRTVEQTIAQIMEQEYGIDVARATRQVTDQVFKMGLSETGRQTSIQIGFGGLDARYDQVLIAQNLFWLQNHHQDGLGKSIMELTARSMDEGLTARELGNQLKAAFQESVKGSQAYFEKLALHSMQRVREIGHITGYEKAGAVAYEIVAVMDERTSDICAALNGKVFPLEQAVAVRDAILDVDLSAGPEAAKEYLKQVSPWVKESQVVYNDKLEPVGIEGAHTPFPPFHWGCRTTTAMIYE